MGRRGDDRPAVCMVKSILLIALWLICAFYFLSSAQNVPPEVLKAAQTGLPELMRAVIPGYAMPGFDKNDSLQKVTLGKPFEFYTVIPKGKINTGVKCKSIQQGLLFVVLIDILSGEIYID